MGGGSKLQSAEKRGFPGETDWQKGIFIVRFLRRFKINIAKKYLSGASGRGEGRPTAWRVLGMVHK
jgi:hypothetical protein